jgi:dihydroflavonol-4-reductase
MSGAVLVTGGTGFFGSHLVRLLRERGEEVRVLTRAASAQLVSWGVDVVEGSLLDEVALLEALDGVGRVYHAAGRVERDPAAAVEMYRLHVDGTRALLSACRRAGVERVVLVSSSGTVAVTSTPEASDERAPYRLVTARRWPYYLSKIYQEKLAFEMAREGGPEVVSILPSLLLGPGDVRQSSTGDVLRFLRKEIPFVPSGGINFVDARDAAAGAILAMERGEASERYLLGGPNWTMGEFFSRLGRVAGMRGPRIQVPDRVARIGARLVERLGAVAGRQQSGAVDPTSVEMSQHFWYCDSSKATRGLGWEPRDPMETLTDTVEDLRQRHFGAPPAEPKRPGYLEWLVTQPNALRQPARMKSEA